MAATDQENDSDSDRLIDATTETAVQHAISADNNGPTNFSDEISKRDLVDQQAALDLALFAQGNTDIALTGDEVGNLVKALIVGLLDTHRQVSGNKG